MDLITLHIDGLRIVLWTDSSMLLLEMFSLNLDRLQGCFTRLSPRAPSIQFKLRSKYTDHDGLIFTKDGANIKKDHRV